ncbi:DUF423 domain-containing protein [Flavobacteriaceae bacterium]|nr:DUF423 domain-containing protein [Flavobacteriaceae bacterium]
MNNLAYFSGALFGFIAIVLGAFGSHLLKKKWSREILDTFEIGVKYQMYHALFLLLLGTIIPNNTTAIYSCILGVLLFSGSIYGICIVKHLKKPVGLLGPLTPLGGLCLLISWFTLLLSLIR